MVPSKYEWYFTAGSLVFTNLTLTVNLRIDNNSLVHELRTTVRGLLPLLSETLEVSIDLCINGTSAAILHTHGRQLQLSELLTDLIDNETGDILWSTGFMNMTADNVSLDLVYGTGKPLNSNLHIKAQRMRNFAKDTCKDSLSATSSEINLDKVFYNTAIKRVEATVVLKAGEISFSVYGTLTLPQLGLSAVIELTSVNAGAGVGAYHLMKLEVSWSGM